MKGLSLILLFFITFSLVIGVQAQGKRGTDYKGKGRKAVVAHEKLGKRMKRTRVVHYHYRHLPRRGTVVKSINTRSVSVKFLGVKYQYHDGIWYRPHGSNGSTWKIVQPAFGARVRALPKGYRQIIVDSKKYFYYYGSFYQRNYHRYEVVKAPVGAKVNSLPDGYNVIVINGNEYYQLDGAYYMPTIDENGEEVLIVVTHNLHSLDAS